MANPSEDVRSKKLSYERQRREQISDKFKELIELLIEYGFPKGEVLTQADALSATIALMRKLLNKGPADPASTDTISQSEDLFKRSRGSVPSCSMPSS